MSKDLRKEDKMLKVQEGQNGIWNVIDENGEVLAEETSNSAAWRAIERLEMRKAGRKGKLYQSDMATTITRK